MQYKNLSFTVWDIGGQERLRTLWRYYFQNTQAIIYVVDSNDPMRVREATDELQSMVGNDTFV